MNTCLEILLWGGTLQHNHKPNDLRSYTESKSNICLNHLKANKVTYILGEITGNCGNRIAFLTYAISIIVGIETTETSSVIVE